MTWSLFRIIHPSETLKFVQCTQTHQGGNHHHNSWSSFISASKFFFYSLELCAKMMSKTKLSSTEFASISIFFYHFNVLYLCLNTMLASAFPKGFLSIFTKCHKSAKNEKIYVKFNTQKLFCFFRGAIKYFIVFAMYIAAEQIDVLIFLFRRYTVEKERFMHCRDIMK